MVAGGSAVDESMLTGEPAARDVGHVVRSLTYFDDADEEPPLRLLIDVDWEEIKLDLVGRVKKLLNPDTT